MSSLMDGISNVNSITAQINSLNSANNEGVPDPEAVLYAFEQNFNQMLNDLISTSDKDDEDKDNNDPFSFLITSNQKYLENMVSKQNLGQASDQILVNTDLPKNIPALPTFLSL